MDLSLALQVASGMASFLLRTTVEWLVCLLLVRIAGSAKGRFNLWLTLLLGFAAQWMWMWCGIVRAAFPGAAHGATGTASAASAGGERIAVAAANAGALSQGMLVLLGGYAAVLAGWILGSVTARVRLARAMRFKRAPEQQVAAWFQEEVRQRGTRACALWVLPGLASPATLGWRYPRVLVPPACQTREAAELKAIFWHELKHVERRDALWNAIARACRKLLWFHPIAHRAAASLNAERELACDAAVVRDHPHCRDVYASCLVRFARIADLAPARVAPAIEMAAGAALLSTRVQSILFDAPGSSRFARTGRTMVNIVLLGAMAVSLPALNILFAAEVMRPEMHGSPAGDAHVRVKTRTAKFAGVKTPGAARLPAQAGVQAAGSNSSAVQHDDQLAAEHRAGMGILTESTGMDEEAGAGQGGNPSFSGAGTGHGASGQPSPSWTAVAVDAAARMGPMLADHDGDDRH